MAYLVSVAVPGKVANIAVVSSNDEANRLIRDLVEMNKCLLEQDSTSRNVVIDNWGRHVLVRYLHQVSMQHLSYLNEYSFIVDYLPSTFE